MLIIVVDPDSKGSLPTIEIVILPLEAGIKPCTIELHQAYTALDSQSGSSAILQHNTMNPAKTLNQRVMMNGCQRTVRSILLVASYYGNPAEISSGGVPLWPKYRHYFYLYTAPFDGWDASTS